MMELFRNPLRVSAVVILVIVALLATACSDSDADDNATADQLAAVEAQVRALQAEVDALTAQLAAQQLGFDKDLDLVASGIIGMLMARTGLPAFRAPPTPLTDIAVELQDQMADALDRIDQLEGS